MPLALHRPESIIMILTISYVLSEESSEEERRASRARQKSEEREKDREREGQPTMARRERQSASDGLASVGRAEPCLSAEFFNQELRFHVRRLLEDDKGGLETFRSTDPRVIENIVELMDRYKRSRKEVIGR